MSKNKNSKALPIWCVVLGSLSFLAYQFVLGQKGKWINYDEVASRVIMCLSLSLVGLGVVLSNQVNRTFFKQTILVAVICVLSVSDFVHFSDAFTESPVVMDATEMLEIKDRKRRKALHIEFRANNTCRFYEPREYGETYFETSYTQSGDTFLIDVPRYNPKLIPHQLVQKGDFMKGDVLNHVMRMRSQKTRYYSIGYQEKPLIVKETFKDIFDKMPSFIHLKELV